MGFSSKLKIWTGGILRVSQKFFCFVRLQKQNKAKFFLGHPVHNNLLLDYVGPPHNLVREPAIMHKLVSPLFVNVGFIGI